MTFRHPKRSKSAAQQLEITKGISLVETDEELREARKAIALAEREVFNSFGLAKAEPESIESTEPAEKAEEKTLHELEAEVFSRR
jgi:hypothetical protein